MASLSIGSGPLKAFRRLLFCFVFHKYSLEYFEGVVNWKFWWKMNFADCWCDTFDQKCSPELVS